MQQILVYSDALSWGIIPATRQRLPFDASRPGVPRILIPHGPLAAKFTGAAEKSAGLSEAFRAVAAELACHFFDASAITNASAVDGIQLDADQHQSLGQALARFVAALPGVLPAAA